MQINIITIIEGVNLIITIVFFVLFLRRALKLRHLGITNLHISKYPWVRIVFAAAYVVFSFALLLYELIHKQFDQDVLQYFMEGGGGECLNSLILIMHAIVLHQQLKKQQPYTKLHLAYMVCLFILSITRVISSVYFLAHSQDVSKRVGLIVIVSVVSLLMILNSVLLGLWIHERKKLPPFDSFSRLNQREIATTLTSNIMSRQFVDNSLMQRYSKAIYPTVKVERGCIRIILQSYADISILKSGILEESKTRLAVASHSRSKRKENKQHLEIISNRLYNIEELHQIYLECSRFKIRQKLNFHDEPFHMSSFYPEVKKYIQELFTIKQAYTSEILSLFDIEKDDIEGLTQKIRQTIVSPDELEVSTFVDGSAMFISIQLFKHLWVKDHFIFYINSQSMDHKDRAVCYKRYSQFEQFHKRMQSILARSSSSFKFPSLPKKHFFGLQNSEQVLERKRDLENYLRLISNDYQLMMHHPEARQCILNFLHLNKIFAVTPNERKHKKLYQNLTITKGSSSKDFVGNDFVTFYEFGVIQNGIPHHCVYRRFSEFQALHDSLQRWMNNTQIIYKFIVLPEKFRFGSEAPRHENLTKYLNLLMEIKDIYQIYPVTSFLELGASTSNTSSDYGISTIKSSSKRSERSINIQEVSGLTSLSSKQRMSLLIDQLGGDQ